jgi:hypothetical protein
MADDPPAPDDDPPDEFADEYDRPPPPPELTPAEQERAFRAQLILFIIMGVFIIAPFVAWWLLSRGR